MCDSGDGKARPEGRGGAARTTLLVGLLAGLLQACGGGGEAPTVAASPPVSTAPETPPSTEPVREPVKEPAKEPEKEPEKAPEMQPEKAPGKPALQPSRLYAQRCSPDNGEAKPSSRIASLATEKDWLRAYMDEAYLWRDEVPEVDANAAAYGGSQVGAALEAYFTALLTPKLTSGGTRRDRFSFMMKTAEWNSASGSGGYVGYGIEWHTAQRTPPRQLRVAFVEAGGPAALAGVQRGDLLQTVGGVDADVGDSAGVAKLNARLYPDAAGQTHAFHFTTVQGASRQVSLTSAELTISPVPTRRVHTASDGAKVGYLLFNSHVIAAEQPLIDAFAYFRDERISDLVLDLRYNGGGYLFLASEAALMVAGRGATAGKVFEQLHYNSERWWDNRSPDSRTPFYDSSCVMVDGDCTSNKPLPELALKRVYILAQKGTCSASESIINGLRGVDVEVILIGGTTCGKPYGFTAKDNCGYSYFPIEFSGTNAKGFGDYADGLSPGAADKDATVKGCRVADDFGRDLGDSSEAMLAAALQHRSTGQCPAVPAGAALALSGKPSGGGAGLAPLELAKSPARTNRILGGRR